MVFRYRFGSQRIVSPSLQIPMLPACWTVCVPMTKSCAEGSVRCFPQLSTGSVDSVIEIETETSFCSCVLGHIWKEKASGSVGRTVFPIHPSLSHVSHAPSCVSCAPWLVVLPLAPVFCFPAAGSSPERLFYLPWTAC